MELLFATSNVHKVSEANRVGRRFGVSFRRIGIPYPEVRDNVVSTVALEGVKFVYAKVKKPVIVEDSGLFVRALGGFPGPYSRYVFDSVGVEGILDLMRVRRDRSAFFVSAVAYSDGRQALVFEGSVDGVIARRARGSSGFGFDPVFIPKGFRKTFAEDPSTKDTVSHRVKAFEAFCSWLACTRKAD